MVFFKFLVFSVYNSLRKWTSGQVKRNHLFLRFRHPLEGCSEPLVSFLAQTWQRTRYRKTMTQPISLRSCPEFPLSVTAALSPISRHVIHNALRKNCKHLFNNLKKQSSEMKTFRQHSINLQTRIASCENTSIID